MSTTEVKKEVNTYSTAQMSLIQTSLVQEKEKYVVRERFLCANHKICSEYVEDEDVPLCVDCSFLFDILVFLPSKVCMLCNEKEEHVQCPECTHSCCIDCFQSLYWDGFPGLKPIFPGSREEKEMYKLNPNMDLYQNNAAIQHYASCMKEWESGLAEWKDKTERISPCFACAKEITLAKEMIRDAENYCR